MSDIVHKAWDFARDAHVGQSRKHYDMPYIVHPVRVAGYVSGHEIGHDPRNVAIALLHDVIEDCGCNFATINEKFGAYVALGVYDLTNRFTKSAYPNLGRKERKENEHIRLSKCEKHVKIIKMYDRLDNICDMFLYSELEQYYLEETLDLLDLIGDADNKLYSFIKDLL